MSLKLEDLEPIADKKIIHRYLQYTIDLHEDITCIFKETNFSFTSRLLEPPPENLLIVLEPPSEVLSAEKFLQAINDTADRQINLTFKTQDTLFILRTKFINVQPGRLTLQAMSPMYKLQRRAHMRFKPTSEAPCLVKLDPVNNLISPELLNPRDVSAGGFSYLATEQEKEFFAKELEIAGTEFYFSSEVFKLDVIVAGRHRLKAPKDLNRPWKIGFKFKKVPTRLEQLLAKEAYNCTQRIFARRI